MGSPNVLVNENAIVPIAWTQETEEKPADILFWAFQSTLKRHWSGYFRAWPMSSVASLLSKTDEALIETLSPALISGLKLCAIPKEGRDRILELFCILRPTSHRMQKRN